MTPCSVATEEEKERVTREYSDEFSLFKELFSAHVHPRIEKWGFYSLQFDMQMSWVMIAMHDTLRN
jgi:hypothetical protein